MPGKRYSAGAIFLQVVPVFANVQRAIEDESKNIDRALGDQMEKSGEKAGERAGKAASKKMNEELRKGNSEFEREFHKSVDSINESLGKIDTNKLSNNLRKELAQMKRELKDLSNVDITADADFKRAHAEIDAIEARLKALRENVKIVFKGDIDNVLAGIAKIKAAKEAIDPTIKMDVDTKPAERKLTSFEKSFKRTAQKAADHLSGSFNKEIDKIRTELKYLENLRIGVDISANQARKELAELMAELEALSHNDPNIDVKVDAGRAWAELAALEAALKKIDGQDVEVDVKTDKAQRGLFGLSSAGDNAANSFRAFNIIMLLVAGAGPALVPVLGAIAGGLLALGPAAAVAGASLGAVLVGFSGISGALQALGNKQDHLSKSTQQAAKGEASAARGIANARRSAARAIESALDAQKSAQERYAQSVKDVKDAEQALAEARAAHKNDGADIALQIKNNALALDQGLLDEFNTTVKFNAVMADGSATNAEKEQARIDMEQAKLRMEELRIEQKKLAADKKKWDKEGVNGAKAVKSAQDQLNKALQNQKDAYKALGKAAKDVDRARADGARSVADAMQGQADAMASVNAQQQAVDAAFSKLGASGQRFALFLFSIRKQFYKFRDDVQSVLLPAVQSAMEGFFASKNAKIARDALIRLAAGFGRFVEALSKSFQGPAWAGFFEMLAKLGPKIQAAYGGAFIKFMEAIASMLTTLAPFALTFAKGLERMMTAFANWAASKDGQEGLLKFMDWVQKMGPDVMKFLIAFIEAAVNLAIALAPWGDVVLKVLTAFLQIMAAMDPNTLGAIVAIMLVLVTASQLAYAAMNIVLAGTALIGSTIGLWVFAIVGIAAAIAFLYIKNEKFRKFVKKAWKEISEAFSKAWKEDIKPALDDLGAAMKELWDKVLQPFFEWLGPIILWVVKQIIPALALGFRELATKVASTIHAITVSIWAIGVTLAFVWNEILVPVWKAIKWGFEALKKSTTKNFERIGSAWEGLMSGMKWVWNHILKPAWNFITDKALPGLKSAFQTTVDAIGKIWEGMKKIVSNPIKFIIDTVINKGLIAGYNKVAGWVHAPKLDDVPIPKGMQNYATGGVMPGYTPGRDVHSFVSPTAGRLELSGGEAVMRPEWTAAMGPGYVHQMNALARRGGVKGVRKAMGFAKGGILNPDDKVYINGMAISRVAAAQVALARQISGIPIYMMQGGFGGNHVAASGSSHNYPGVGDFGPGTIALEKTLRQVGFAAWARNIAGRSSVGSGAHIHAASLLDPGDKSSPQIYGSWANHGNGLSGYNNDPAPHYSWIPGLVSKVASMGVGQIASLIGADGKGGGHRSIPGWLLDTLKNPLSAVKGWITKPLSAATDAFGDSPFFGAISKVPLLLASKTVDKVWDIVPGWAKTAAGWAGDAAHWVVGGVKGAAHHLAEGAADAASGVKHGAGAVADFLGLANGGILPYNGTMKYDSGGYLPPGLTSVVNLTGKPEPVFTDNQWSGMSGGKGGGIHYEPHFEGSNLTAEDVAGDLNFTFRRLKRGGKYGGVGQ